MLGTPTSTSTNRLTGTVAYDSAGNLTSWNGNTYQYDQVDQLVRFTSGAQDWIYIYGPDDERFWSYKTDGAGSVWASNPVSTAFSSDRLGRSSRIDLHTGEVTARIRLPARRRRPTTRSSC